MKNLFKFSVACPKHNKEQVVSLNNINKWLRFKKSTISNEYKNLLNDWHIPTPNKKLKKAFIVFELYRHNKRILDSDNLGIIIKWTIDAIKNSGWLVDDDQIFYTVVPSTLDLSLKETEITLIMFENIEDYILYLKEKYID